MFRKDTHLESDFKEFDMKRYEKLHKRLELSSIVLKVLITLIFKQRNKYSTKFEAVTENHFAKCYRN